MQRRAFSLIELLVTLAVIAGLIALLLPALRQGKEHARVAQCLSNLRQIHVAHTAYLLDGKGWFMKTGAKPGWNFSWHFAGRTDVPYMSHLAAAPPRLLNPYLGYALFDETHGAFLRCASDEGTVNLRTGEMMYAGRTNFDHTGNSYWMNGALLGFHRPGSDRSVKPGQTSWQALHEAYIQNDPASVLLTGDAQWYYATEDATFEARRHRLADDTAAVVFLDGHAEVHVFERGIARTDRYPYGISRPAW